jgi:hypothetical protein
MTKLNPTQEAVLKRVAAEGGAISRDSISKSAATAFIRKGLLVGRPNGQLQITDDGRSAVGVMPAAEPAHSAPTTSKIVQLIELMRRPQGGTIETMMSATGWQAHSVRGAIAGTIKKKQGLEVSSEKTASGRVYRIVEEAGA